MSELGRFGVFPFDFGGVDSDEQAEHQAILKALEPAWDVSEGTEVYEEAYSDAVAVASIWAVNRRLANWLIPARMLESLPVWEESCGLKPSVSDSGTTRRNRVAGKLRGLTNNAFVDIESAVRNILGSAFDVILTVDPTDEVTFWPGINPGPPGLEWSSNRVKIAVKIERANLDDAQFSALRSDTYNQLDAMTPAWMTFAIGSGDGFTVGNSVIGQVFI